MTVSFNYTGRIDIDSDLVTANITESGSRYQAEITWDFGVYSFPKSAELSILFQGVYEQIIVKIGSISDEKETRTFDISTLRKPLDSTITIKVVDKDIDGIPILKGLLTHFRPTVDGKTVGEHSILPTQRDPNLKVPWRVITASGKPVLHISDLENLHAELSNSSLFIATVIPAVLEAAFEWLIWNRDLERDVEIVDEWKNTFQNFGIDESTIDDFMEIESPELDDITRSREVIRHAIDGYSEKKKLIKEISELFMEEK
jgi:hypothetical protein